MNGKRNGRTQGWRDQGMEGPREGETEGLRMEGLRMEGLRDGAMEDQGDVGKEVSLGPGPSSSFSWA